MDSSTASIAALGATQSVTIFLTTLPTFRDLAAMSPNGHDAVGVRFELVVSALLSTSIGGALSMMIDSPAPLLSSAMISLLLVCVYEYTIRKVRVVNV